MADTARRTIADVLAAGADDAPALMAEGAAPMSHGALRRLVETTGAALAGHGIGPGDRVAIVLPNGAEMAAAFLAISACATAAPLNPSYRAEEFAFYLSDLGAKLLVVAEGADSPALAVAAEMDVPLVRLRPTPERGAGSFTLPFADDTTDGAFAPAGPDDIALVLHTSGTTSRPKIVPLAQRNLAASAGNIARSLAFTAGDVGLGIMPLFHIHGLIAGVLAPLSAGGAVHCTPGFNALSFFATFEKVQPTWYSAVPTMHQAILGRARHNAKAVEGNRLRFVRSSSASLPPQVLRQLEETFGAPVIEAYGMTEAAHQMASNPLPPGERRPGSVGVAAGPAIRVVDTRGDPVLAGTSGEIVISGGNVMAGYENNPAANAEAFTPDGWFRTGDQGILDASGYLTITGRLKEIINRGGEKISPREVDEVLLDHPHVAQCVTFAVRHAKLGEDVAAAVVLAAEASADESALRAFVAERLADFKVPRRILVLEEIPKGATGKIQRIGLAAKLGLEPQP
ncbi:acyl--CoA ligase [Marinivivus vitaminiproducens]|uniref:acyl--CoA ligase n=1 Tax=Marinivivus vitaminiproducens TaxID=3035935 RepID=UPI0027A7D66C|nr:acyl--CoA ligase [Geminicoccaceae bacterium SCSIO 64248]